MNELREFLDNLWRWSAREKETEFTVRPYEEIVRNIEKHWFPVLIVKFKKLIMGGLRYGKITPERGFYDRLPDIEFRLTMYKDTGNLEYLYDASNLIDLEIIEGIHPNKHWKEFDDGIHTKEVLK